MALGSTQPLTEMNTTNISWGVKAAGASGQRSHHLHVPTAMKSGSLSLLEPSVPVQACNGIASPHISLAAQPLLATPPADLFSDNTDVTVLFVSFFLLCFSFAFRLLTCADITARLHAVLFQCKKSLMSVRDAVCVAQPSKCQRSSELRTLSLIFITFFMAQGPLLEQGLLIIEASRLHPDVP